MSDQGLRQSSTSGTASFTELLGDLFRDLTGLVRSEGRLMRAELVEAGKSVAVGVEMMAAGAVALLVALIVLAQALVIFLSDLVGAGWAAVIVGAVLGLIGALLIVKARHNMSAAKLMPERTLEQTSRDIQLAKEQI